MSNAFADGLTLTNRQWDCMLADVSQRAPYEACGLLGGIGAVCLAVIPTTNSLHSRVSFRVEPVEQLRAFHLLERHNLELIGIYHSHPGGPPELSPHDLAQAYYPGVVHLVWSPHAGGWQCRGFRLVGGLPQPVALRVER